MNLADISVVINFSRLKNCSSENKIKQREIIHNCYHIIVGCFGFMAQSGRHICCHQFLKVKELQLSEQN